MSERSNLIDKLLQDRDARVSYIRATLGTIIPSQLKALRLREKLTQKGLGWVSGMKQSRVSASEKSGTTYALETLVRFAATYRLGIKIEFVPFSEMLRWENSYSQDHFKPAQLEADTAFLSGDISTSSDNSDAYQFFQVDVPPPKPTRGASTFDTANRISLSA